MHYGTPKIAALVWQIVASALHLLKTGSETYLGHKAVLQKGVRDKINYNSNMPIKQSLKTFLLFFIPLIILYFPTRKAGFVTDFNGWQLAFDTQSFGQILNGDNHDIKSFYHFTHILMYIMSSLFGKWGLPWYVTQCALVSLDCVLILKLFKQISRLFNFKNATIIALLGISFWVSSPYLAEVMVWRAAFHYPLVFAMHLGYLIWTIKFMETHEKKYIYYANGLFVLSLFSLEYFFVTPFLVLSILILCALNSAQKFSDILKTYSNAFIGFFCIPLSIIGLYMLVFYAHYGQWVSHDRQADAPFLFFNLDSYSTYAKYVAKHLFFIRYLEHSQKEAIFNFFSRQNVQIIALITILGISICGAVFFKRMKSYGKLLYWCFTFFSLWLIPAVSLAFSTLLLTEHDRFAFIPSVFLMLALAMVLSRFPRKIFYGLSVLYICFSMYLTFKTNQIWQKSATVYWALMDNFKWRDSKDEIILLNVPESMQGMYMFRNYGYKSIFPEVMDIYQRTNISKNTTEAMRYNMTDIDSGAKIVVDAPDTIRVILNQPGSWFIMKDWRAETYETPSYKALQREWDYQLILKPSPRKRILLYQMGQEWKVVDTTKVGIEQK